MALSAELGLTVHQMDVVTAFLNGDIEEELFMEVPNGLEDALNEIVNRDVDASNKLRDKAKGWLKELRQNGPKACRIRKAIYGLRQSGRQWYKTLDVLLKHLGLTPTQANPCLYVRRSGEFIVIVAVYVDDILIATNKTEMMSELKQKLMKAYRMVDFGPVSNCLGIEFKQYEDGSISMCQKRYAAEVLARFNMIACNPTSTPMDGNEKLNKPEASETESGDYPYQNLIGSLMYLATCTRPDIAHTVSCLSQFNQCHSRIHWNAAKRVLRYLKENLTHGLMFKRSGIGLHGFVDADWAGCPINRRSYTGYAFLLAQTAVSWEAKKQRTVALSSTEAEYITLADGAKEAIYLLNLLREFGVNASPVTIYNDNQGAQELAKNAMYHSRTKHIDARHHFVREAFADKKIQLQHRPTSDMPADLLTKSLFGPKHHTCVKLLGMLKIYISVSFTLRGGVVNGQSGATV